MKAEKKIHELWLCKEERVEESEEIEVYGGYQPY